MSKRYLHLLHIDINMFAWFERIGFRKLDNQNCSRIMLDPGGENWDCSVPQTSLHICTTRFPMTLWRMWRAIQNIISKRAVLQQTTSSIILWTRTTCIVIPQTPLKELEIGNTALHRDLDWNNFPPKFTMIWMFFHTIAVRWETFAVKSECTEQKPGLGHILMRWDCQTIFKKIKSSWRLYLQWSSSLYAILNEGSTGNIMEVSNLSFSEWS